MIAFSAKQRATIRLLSLGLTNAQIGQQLNTTADVVKNILRDVFDTTGMSSRLELTLWWLKGGNNETEVRASRAGHHWRGFHKPAPTEVKPCQK
jgi:DNA-binding CsgD family transcriptional regulator